MIKPANLYELELNNLYINTFYDPKYMYYRGCWGTSEIIIPDNTYDSHHFVIVDNNDDIIGYITYAVNYASGVASNFGIISFKPSICFGRDLLKIIDDIFCKYSMNKIEFRAILDNPIIKHYYKFIEKFGGKFVGVLKDSIILEDGKLHDDVMFELFKKDYIKNKNK